jgi:uncharacterized membrane protein
VALAPAARAVGVEERHTKLAIAGWILTALAVVFPPLAIASIALGATLARRGRVGTGVAIVLTSILAVAASVYLATQTLQPRD